MLNKLKKNIRNHYPIITFTLGMLLSVLIVNMVHKSVSVEADNKKVVENEIVSISSNPMITEIPMDLIDEPTIEEELTKETLVFNATAELEKERGIKAYIDSLPSNVAEVEMAKGKKILAENEKREIERQAEKEAEDTEVIVSYANGEEYTAPESTPIASTTDATYSSDRDDPNSDLYILAHIINGEAGGCTWCSDTMCYYVGSVVLNRVKSDIFPNSISEVAFQSGQYACTWDGNYYKPMLDRSWTIAEDLLANGSVLPDYVLYQANFAQGNVYCVEQNMYFGY